MRLIQVNLIMANLILISGDGKTIASIASDYSVRIYNDSNNDGDYTFVQSFQISGYSSIAISKYGEVILQGAHQSSAGEKGKANIFTKNSNNDYILSRPYWIRQKS